MKVPDDPRILEPLHFTPVKPYENVVMAEPIYDVLFLLAFLNLAFVVHFLLFGI